jgi:hypothetical protein
LISIAVREQLEQFQIKPMGNDRLSCIVIAADWLLDVGQADPQVALDTAMYAPKRAKLRHSDGGEGDRNAKGQPNVDVKFYLGWVGTYMCCLFGSAHHM